MLDVCILLSDLSIPEVDFYAASSPRQKTQLIGTDT